MKKIVKITEGTKDGFYRVQWETGWFEAQAVDETLPWQTLGTKLQEFLDGDKRFLGSARTDAKENRETLDLYVDVCHEAGRWPFELLDDEVTRVIRLAGESSDTPPGEPQDRPLKLLFLAASPLDGGNELAFEQEEEMIFRVTRNLAVDMEVEDSGSLEGLRERLLKEKFDIVHLSGHGNIDTQGLPYFILESETTG
jgi:hypothetical protein